MKNRWISYTSQNIPGSQSFELGFHPNLEDVKASFAEFCRAVDSTDCTSSVYFAGEDQSMYDLAKEYEGIGCPFDYPDKMIERGPRGGIKVTNT